MNIFSFHLMPWPYLPEDYEGSAAVTLPNSMFDREKGAGLINLYFDELVACEGLGFDGVGVNEHHRMAWGLMGSPNLAAGILAARTRRMKILVLGPALAHYGNPVRVAEEIALLDLVSGGRIIVGPVVGGAVEYFGTEVPPTDARGRYREALELILQAWTRPGPFEFHGDHFNLQYVNPWLLPLQRPHPPVWIPGAGSPETIEMCVDRGFTYAALPFFPRDFTNRSFGLFRERWLKKYDTPDPGKLSLLVPIYVGETDEQARKEFEPHFRYWSHKLTKGFNSGAPGYLSEMATIRMMAVLDKLDFGKKSFREVEDEGYVIIGSPSTVQEKLMERIHELGTANLLGMFQIGSMLHNQTMTNLQAFSSEVMPTLRKALPNGPSW